MYEKMPLQMVERKSIDRFWVVGILFLYFSAYPALGGSSPADCGDFMFAIRDKEETA